MAKTYGMFSDPYENTFQERAATIASSMRGDDPWGNVGKAIGLFLASRKQPEKSTFQMETDFVKQFSDPKKVDDPNHWMELSEKASAYPGLERLSSKMLEKAMTMGSPKVEGEGRYVLPDNTVVQGGTINGVPYIVSGGRLVQAPEGTVKEKGGISINVPGAPSGMELGTTRAFLKKDSDYKGLGADSLDMASAAVTERARQIETEEKAAGNAISRTEARARAADELRSGIEKFRIFPDRFDPANVTGIASPDIQILEKNGKKFEVDMKNEKVIREIN